MASLIERALQRELLEYLADKYPNALCFDEDDRFGGKANDVLVNLYYLHEHGLVECKYAEFFDGNKEVIDAKITAKGIDFLADDGGLGAILRVMTVRFDESTIKQLLVAKIDAADAEPSAKEELKQSIRKMPGNMLEKLMEKTLEAGLGSLPQLVPWLSHVVHHL